MALEKKIDFAAVILKLLQTKNETTLAEIAVATKLTAASATDRRAIQRALAKLIQKEIITVKGNARARAYTLRDKTNQPKDLENIFSTHSSIKLLNYLAKPIHARKPVGYQQNFLSAYIPNKTSYLSAALRKELFSIGKVENIMRPAGTYARNILNKFLIDLSWNSSRLEGNTYSLLETKRLIEFGESAAGKDATEAQMILNHKNAIEYIIESADENKISSYKLCSIHALLSENLLGDPSASGRLRNISVGISGTTYLPLDNPHLLREYFDLFIKKINLIKDPFEQSFFTLVHLSYLQAFEDVNKRTTRLTANIPLIKQNLQPLSFVDVNKKDYALSLLGVYEKNDISLLRDLYVWAYKRSSQRYSALQQSMGEPNIFKLKYRNAIQEIVHTIILAKTPATQIVQDIKKFLKKSNLSSHDSEQLFQIIETEIMSLHEGNIARFKIKPSEFQQWKRHNN